MEYDSLTHEGQKIALRNQQRTSLVLFSGGKKVFLEKIVFDN
jgi:hypothetical protein